MKTAPISSSPVAVSADLITLKRNVEKAIDRVTDWIHAAGRMGGLDINETAISDFRYTHPNVNQVRTTWARRWAAARKVIVASKVGDQIAEIDLRVAEALVAADYALIVVKADKKRLADKRAAIAAKAALKKDLNLQEGVSLAGVDVGQYEVILAGLEPVRKFVFESRVESLQKRHDKALAELQGVAMSYGSWNPYPKTGSDIQQQIYAHRSETLALTFKHDGDGKTVSVRDDARARIEAKATTLALAYIQGYAAKLAIKTGEYIANELNLHKNVVVESAKVASANNLWASSLATIALRFESGVVETIQFHTQMIFNTSCLGKVFNQYPTRLVKGGAR